MTALQTYEKTRAVALSVLLVLIAATAALAAEDHVMESSYSRKDVVLTLDPAAAFWQGSRPVFMTKDPFGGLLPRYRSEVRSRWTNDNLYFLFICPYEELNLKPSPNTAKETFQLWNWDVAEVFIGSDFQNIGRYKEFEISPQGEWIDLNIDLCKPHPEEGWTWNSGFQIAARIDPLAKVWYGAMRIPISALSKGPPSIGETFRINLFRTQGPPPDRIDVVWQPTMGDTFHTPEKFGLLKLVKQQSK